MPTGGLLDSVHELDTMANGTFITGALCPISTPT